MLCSQTRIEIQTRIKLLGMTDGMARLQWCLVTGRNAPSIDCLTEEEGQKLSESLWVIIKSRRANAYARVADLRGAEIGGSRAAELEAQG